MYELLDEATARKLIEKAKLEGGVKQGFSKSRSATKQRFDNRDDAEGTNNTDLLWAPFDTLGGRYGKLARPEESWTTLLGIKPAAGGTGSPAAMESLEPEGERQPSFVKNSTRVAIDPSQLPNGMADVLRRLEPPPLSSKPNRFNIDFGDIGKLPPPIGLNLPKADSAALPSRPNHQPPASTSNTTISKETLGKDASVGIVPISIDNAVQLIQVGTEKELTTKYYKDHPEMKKRVQGAMATLEAKLRQYKDFESLPISLKSVVYGLQYGNSQAFSYDAVIPGSTIEPFGPGTYKCNLFVGKCLGKGGGIRYDAPGSKFHNPNGVPTKAAGNGFYSLRLANDWASDEKFDNFRHLKPGEEPQVGDVVAFRNKKRNHPGHVGFYLGNGLVLSAGQSRVQINTIDDNMPGHDRVTFRRYTPGWRGY